MRVENSPVVASVQALMSKTTPFGDLLSVVLTTVISILDTGVLDGILDESSCAGFVLSSVGLEVDEIGFSLTFFPSGE